MISCYSCREPIGFRHKPGCPRARTPQDCVKQVDVLHGVDEPALKWTGDPECAPKRALAGDVGFDLIIEEDTRIHVGSSCDVPHGICVEMPPGVWGMIVGRSSTVRRRGLLVVTGIIDNGYRGDVPAMVYNLGSQRADLHRGERIAQLLLFPMVDVPAIQVAELSESERGKKNFGSTGD